MDPEERKTQHLRQFLMREASREEIEHHLAGLTDDQPTRSFEFNLDAPGNWFTHLRESTESPLELDSSGDIELIGEAAGEDELPGVSLYDTSEAGMLSPLELDSSGEIELIGAAAGEDELPGVSLDDTSETGMLSPLELDSSGEIELIGEDAREVELPGVSSDDTSESGWGKIISLEEPEASPAKALETIVHKTFRPTIDLIHGTFDRIPSPPWNESLEQARPFLARVIPAVGRVEIVKQFSRTVCATGVLVAPDLFLTSQDRLRSAVQGSRLDASFLSDARLEVDFSEEAGTKCRAVEVVMLHPAWDVAVLRLDGPLPTPAQLAGMPPESMEGKSIANIGYPVIEPGSETDLLLEIFHGVSGVKRISPGYLRTYEAKRWKEHWLSYVTDDATTLGQKSGSPVVDLQTGQVLGLNYSSDYLVANYSIPAWELAKDHHFRDIGIDFGVGLPEAPPAWMEAWDQDAAPPLGMPSASNRSIGGIRTGGGAHGAISTGGPSAREDLARWLVQVFPDVSHFRKLLQGTEHAAADRAVRFEDETVYYREFVAALDRRAQIDREFFASLSARDDLNPNSRRELQKIAESFGVVISPLPVAREDVLLPWEQLHELERLISDLRVPLDFLAYGTEFRDLLIPQDGDNPYRIVERLASNPDPDAPKALRWFLQQLLDRDPPDRQRDEVIKEALRVVQGLTEPVPELDDGFRVPFVIPQSSTPMDVLRQYMTAAAAVVRISQVIADHPPQPLSTGWLLSPGLVVFPAHCVVLEDSYRFRGHRTQGEIDQLRDQWQVEFESGELLSGRVEQYDERLDLALLRLNSSTNAQPLRVSPSVDVARHEPIVLIQYMLGGLKQFSQGYFLHQDGQDSIYMAPTGSGTSGAPVLNRNGQVVATHRAWRGWRTDLAGNRLQAKLGTAVDSMLEWISSVRPDLWNEVQSAQRSLKSVVDQALSEMLRQRQQQDGPEARVSFYFSVYGQPDLQNVPDLIIGSSDGRVVTGTGTQRTVDTLAAMPEILSISPSTSTGTLECHSSMPRIGAIAVRNRTGELGTNALIGVIDSGIDVLHQAFLDGKGKTRILAFWDQTYQRGDGKLKVRTFSKDGAALAQRCKVTAGALYAQADIQKMVKCDRALKTIPDRFLMQHGTTVCSIAAGRATGAAPHGFPGGVAPDARLIVVRYDTDGASIGYSSGHMNGLAFIDAIAREEKLPVVVNISNGMNSGAHDGTTDLEMRCNEFCTSTPGRVIVKSAGNEQGTKRHAELTPPLNLKHSIRWHSTSTPETKPGGSDRIEVWFPRRNEYRFSVQPPSGRASPDIKKNDEFKEALENGNRIITEYNECHRSNLAGHMWFEIHPGDKPDVESGMWKLNITCLRSDSNSKMHLWIEISYRREAYFPEDYSSDYTLTIPGTAEHVICVGAVDTASNSICEAIEELKLGGSSIGPACVWKTSFGSVEKPDLVAPGAPIRAAKVNTGTLGDTEFETRRGTSVSAPHVTGAIALLLSKQHALDPLRQFTAQRVLAALIDNTRDGIQRWNPLSGYGELDVERLFDAVFGR